MNQLIIDDMPELYNKLKPYIDFLESLGFKSKEFDVNFFTPHDKDNYEYFNTWKYDSKLGNGVWADLNYVCDLVSYTGELKLEIYTYKTRKYTKQKLKQYSNKESLLKFPYYFDVSYYDDVDDEHKIKSVIVDNFKDFQKEISKYLKRLKQFKELKRKYELESDFT